jgi:hypothetical protein
MGVAEMSAASDLIDRVLTTVSPLGELEWRLADDIRDDVRRRVRGLCDAFPIPAYPGLVERVPRV